MKALVKINYWHREEKMLPNVLKKTHVLSATFITVWQVGKKVFPKTLTTTQIPDGHLIQREYHVARLSGVRFIVERFITKELNR